MKLALHICIVLLSVGYSVVFSHNSEDTLLPTELEESQRLRKNGGRERYRYRNGRRYPGYAQAPARAQRRGQGQLEDDNLNPLFPPRQHIFWETGKLFRRAGGRKDQRQAKRLEPPPSKSNKRASSKRSLKRPNIILILTDDQDIELGSMEYMPETLKVFRENGAEFRHGYVTTPMCCPSRSSILTGLYVHNHQVYTNNDNCSSIHWRQKFESKTFAAHLRSSGYYTSYIGKYLNKYDGSHIPVGWDEWNTLLMNSRFYNYTVNRNGRNIRYGNQYERDYYPDSITNDTIDFLDRMASPKGDRDSGGVHLEDELDVPDEDSVKDDASGTSSELPLKKFKKPDQPFLLVVSFPSPHGPEDSAPQYSQMFLNETPHHTPAYNFAPNSDKQWILQVTSKMNSNLKDFTNLLMSKRLQTLQSVDVSVKHIFERLRSSGLDEDTYVFYTSDHGYHVGQFGLIKGKSMPFEFDIRVPFFVRTSKKLGISGTVILEPVLNIDLAPTFLDLGGVPVPSEMDGRSLLPLIQKYSRRSASVKGEPFEWTHTFLIESSGRRESNSERHIGLTKHLLVEPLVRPLFPEDKTARIRELCELHPYPCLTGQRKYCNREKERTRFRKCRAPNDFLEGGRGSSKRCQCPSRAKRNAPENIPEDYDWEAERQKIDAEIEILRARIDELRERRRLLRHHWMATTSNPLISKISEYTPGLENGSSFTERKQLFKKKNRIHVSILRTPEKARAEVTRAPTEILKPSIILTSDHIKSKVLQPEVDESIKMYDENEDDDVFLSGRGFGNSGEDETDETLISTFSNTSHDPYSGRTPNPIPGFVEEITPNERNPHASPVNEAEDCDCSGYKDVRLRRQEERENRKRKKLMSRLRKKQRFLNRIRDPTERQQAETCGAEEKMNCFWHDKSHWRTIPLWEGESFCFCMNSINNTFSCLRSINSTHNYLYCHFITGFKMYFDLGRDPFQLRNSIGNLSEDDEGWMVGTLLKLKRCQGRRDCQGEREPTPLPRMFSYGNSTMTIVGDDEALEHSIWEKVFGTFKRKRVRNGTRRKHHLGK